MLSDINLSLFEILSLIGFVQCIFLLVYIGMRMTRLKHAIISFLYFTALACAFFFDMAEAYIADATDIYYYLQWFAWFLGPPLSVLMIFQVADIDKKLPFREYWIVILIPLCFALSFAASDRISACQTLEPCEELKSFMSVTGLLASAISLLVIFSRKNLFNRLRRQKLGKERYWLILVLVILNCMMLCTLMANLLGVIEIYDAEIIRTILGLAFVYLVSTSLLRLYPKAQKQGPIQTPDSFTQSEKDLAQKIEHLILVDKIYQEPAYSRTDLAKECGVSEILVSKVLNAYFKKSFPQLMNTHRVEEAKHLLTQTNANISIIAGEVGFNSLPSFNRVFKDFTNTSPSLYRTHAK